MSASFFRRTFALLLLSLVLTVPWASAAGLRAESASPAKSSAVSPDLLSRLWSTLAGLWSEEGCYIDPSGRCGAHSSAAPPPTEQVDTGCYIDPNGRCGAHSSAAPPPTEQVDTGCYIDPSGRCGAY